MTGLPPTEILARYTQETSASFTDGLTGLFNHGFFLLYLQQELYRFERGGPPFALCLVDIDEFSRFIARNGPLAGERRLREVAETIRAHTRKGDIVARFQGDRFALMCFGDHPEQISRAAERIRQAVAETSPDALTVSIGVASPTTGRSSPDLQCLISRAMEAMRRAKSHGKNRVQQYTAPPADRPEEAAHILVVDDEPLNRKLIAGLLQPLNGRIHTAADGEAALYTLAHSDIDLILLDVMMPGMDGYEVCRRIKGAEETRMLPVVLITALDDVESKVRGIEAGADDFITKPPNRTELVARVRSLLRVRRLNSSLASIEDVLFSLANSVEAKDSYTQGHVARVSQMAMAIGRRMGLTAKEMEALRLGGALHDIGKLGVPEAVLNKPGPLTPDEWRRMQQHTEVGYRICLPLKKTLGAALEVIRHHHEKLDGSGYPDGLAGDQISIAARVMAVADIYDALTSDRPYRKGMPKEKALTILAEETNAGELDPTVVEWLVTIVSGRSTGSERSSPDSGPFRSRRPGVNGDSGRLDEKRHAQVDTGQSEGSQR